MGSMIYKWHREGQVFQGVYLNGQVAIKVLNIDYDDPAGAAAVSSECKRMSRYVAVVTLV
jgi:hypothetical protein